MPWTAFLRSASLCSLLVLPAVALFYTFQLSGGPAAADYDLALWAVGMLSLGFVGPIAAAVAAWEVDRLRRSGLLTRASARPHIRVIASTVWPIIVAGLAGIWLCGVLATSYAGIGQVIPPVPVAVMATAVIIAHTAIGCAVGSRVRAVIAAPLLLVGGYVLMLQSQTLEPLWLRHLGGTMNGCCRNSDVFDSNALLAGLIVNAGLLVAAGVLLFWRARTALTASAAALVTAIALFLAIGRIDTLGADAVSPRADTMNCASADQSEYCVWSEHRNVLPGLLQTGKRLNQRWRAAGIGTPKRYTEARTPSGVGEISVSARITNREIEQGLLYASIPLPACAEQEQFIYDSVSRDAAQYWLAAKAGINIPPDTLDPEAIKKAKTVLRQDADQQLEWFNSTRQKLKSCKRIAE